MSDEVPRLDPRLTPFAGWPADGPVKGDVLDNFEACPACGQLIDRRDLAAVVHHGREGHARLPEKEATRLVSLEDRLRVALLQGTVDRRMNC
jgi:hypothetical protein